MRLLLLLALLLSCPAAAREPAIVRVRLQTSAGPIVIALDARRAPRTVENFLAYVDDERFDGTTFYRAARSKRAPRQGFIQAGIRTDARRILPPFPLETTAMTGIRHTDGAISMARGSEPGSAGGNFVLLAGPAPQMDARAGYLGYAAFGHVVSGMAVVRRILALPTGGGMDAFKGQMILKPVRLITARRLDGTRKPTGLVKPWLIETRARAPRR
ncbi:peptidylprolyl isomerase [Sphingomonas sp.]|jgi:peptidyl-prolyl cis-trans isomerase A (cyclophilin A)|uniref:peptidylprolyl isomerase n=1 Tax=Sphingomonas sp. TaxID=28214 RepID=UPI002EDBAC85